ncbi:unnamed protein product [Mytilus edulis]|uniref:Uncharacterized protein n=1 Tax=Mytilus edulis TaxID=6550 RepID=A0A8S3PR99_MYTED|nr:unnamed protein product [Mytilus edulis]
MILGSTDRNGLHEEQWSHWDRNFVAMTTITDNERKDIDRQIQQNDDRFTVVKEVINIEMFSSFPKLLRIMSYVLRFMANCRTLTQNRKYQHLEGISHYEACKQYPDTMKQLNNLEKEIPGGTTTTYKFQMEKTKSNKDALKFRAEKFSSEKKTTTDCCQSSTLEQKSGESSGIKGDGNIADIFATKDITLSSLDETLNTVLLYTVCPLFQSVNSVSECQIQILEIAAMNPE